MIINIPYIFQIHVVLISRDLKTVSGDLKKIFSLIIIVDDRREKKGEFN